MAFYLGLWENGAEILNVDSGSYDVLEYNKATPPLGANGDYDLYNPIGETVRIQVNGTTRTLWENAVAIIERLLGQAARQERTLEIGTIPDKGTLRVFSRLWGGWVERADTEAFVDNGGRVSGEIVVHWTRQPDWLAAEQAIALTTNLTNNGLLNYIVLPALLGELPAPARLRLTGSGGNINTANVVLAAERTQHIPASFTHQFQASAYSARSAEVSDQVDATQIGGTIQKWVPTDSSEKMLIQWSATGAAAAALEGQFLLLVKYRDRAAVPNYFLRARVGVEVGGVQQMGNYSGALVKTKSVDGSNVAETGMMDIGILQIPKASKIILELRGKAVAVTNSIHIVFIALMPFGDPLPGKGAEVATLAFPIAANRAYLSSYINDDASWLADGSDVRLAGALGYPAGGDLLLPPQVAGNRIYLYVTTDGSAVFSASFRHDHTTLLSAAMFYRPRFIAADGGV